MLRRLFALALALSLGGCATYETRYYDEYDDGYYAATDDGYGDYYVGQPSYRYVDRYDYPGYLAWPAYHSMFWGISRWYYDPFYYPGYYYGVTYFPRGYFAWSSGWTRYRFDVSHRYFPYSPYRYAWHDHYYDWEPWYRSYPSHRHWHPEPRYGSARNEAERLAWESRNRYRERPAQTYSSPRQARDPRAADYRSRTREREDPRVGAFGPDPRTRSAREAARTQSGSPRTQPRNDGYRVQRSDAQRSPARREADAVSSRSPRTLRDTETRDRPIPVERRLRPSDRDASAAPRPVERDWTPSPRPTSPARVETRPQRGYAAPERAPPTTRYERNATPAPAYRERPQPAMQRTPASAREPARSYAPAAPRAEPRMAPAPSRSVPPDAAPRSAPAAATQRQSAPAPRESSASRSEARRSARGSRDED